LYNLFIPQYIHLPDDPLQPPDRNIGDGVQGATIRIGHGEEGVRMARASARSSLL